MFNRNFCLLVRNICAAVPRRIDPKNLSYFNARYYTKKSSSSDENSCGTCKSDSDQEPTITCEPPISQYPTIPPCPSQVEAKSPPKPNADAAGSASCARPVCPPPKEQPPCAPICTEKTKKPVCPPKSAKVNFFRMLSLFVVLPAIIALSAYVFMTRQEIDRPPFVPYPFMRKRNFAGRKWPWNSDKSLFYNGRVNALHDGYEFEEDDEKGEGVQKEGHDESQTTEETTDGAAQVAAEENKD